MIQAIVRPEKTGVIFDELAKAGFSAITEMDVYGRGKQQGVTIGSVHYDELPKTMLLVVIEDQDEQTVTEIIIRCARTGENNIGDGKIFVIPVERVYTVSSGQQEL
jgi:nitrogen regulatory protein PII 1